MQDKSEKARPMSRAERYEAEGEESIAPPGPYRIAVEVEKFHGRILGWGVFSDYVLAGGGHLRHSQLGPFARFDSEGQAREYIALLADAAAREVGKS